MIKKYDLKIWVLAIVGIMLGSCSPTQKQSYNVLFISVDDLNDWTAVFGGHPQTITPNIDRLASEGIAFQKAYCAASVCNPSRAAIMSGIRPSSSGVYQNNHYMRSSDVLAEAKTIPQWFSEHGYFTTAKGKIFHHPNGKWADTISWDEWHHTTGDGLNQHPNWSKTQTASGMPINKGGQAHFDWGSIAIEDSLTSDFHSAQWAADLLSKEHEKPFFIGCGIFRPHLPWYVPQKYFDMFPLDSIILPELNENDLDDVPAIGRNMSSGLEDESDYQRVKKYNLKKQAVQAYLANIAYADAAVGLVLDALKNSKYASNTVVVLWGDHGWNLGEKLHYRKFVLWEESCRVPFIIKVPGNAANGQNCERTVNLLDIYPTLTDLCGIPSNPSNEGRSIVPLIKNPTLQWPYPALTTMGYKRHAVRDENWRYIQYDDGSEELYDHQNDPLEWKNLASDTRYDTVKVRLQKWLPELNHPAVEPTKPGE